MPLCPSCGQLNPARARFCMSCAEPLPPPSPAPSEARKTLTVLFCDVVGSTPIGERLDPESVRTVMSRFFEQMRIVLERHGGTVEKYIGDAVMGVFGVPVLHEDDALRAVRAAAEMHIALSDLNAELEPIWDVVLTTRIGINTGEVVVGGAAGGGALVVGDAVNVAARLEQTAAPGEVLLGPDTYALVRDSVTVDEGRSLSLKGKTGTVIGYRLIDVAPAMEPGRRQEPGFVGREPELEALRRAFDRSVRERTCVLLTVLGSAGVGKSRLAREFVASVQDEARVVRGRCLPYGDGITFWPIVEMVREASGIADTDPLQAARAKIDEAVAGVDGAEQIADRVAAVSGFAETSAEMQETFWAIRRFLEALQRDRPLVVVFDDVQWAEPTFLDLVEYLAGWTRDARTLVMCLGRPDLLDLRPAWATMSSAETVTLSPLTDAESQRLIANLLGASSMEAAASSRIVEAAEGNPLFVEEMLRMLEDEGFLAFEDGRWHVVGDLSRVEVPATIQALLAARLDRLTPEEKAVLGCAAVIGKVFWWGAVSELSSEPIAAGVGTHLQTLVRKGLIRPDRSSLVGEDAFRFHHLLIQEAAYQGLPKERRAELHERFADWMERRAGDRLVEYEEVVGYHLEQAYRYRRELGAQDDRMAAIAERAADRLASAGRRALARGDMAASANLLERASSLCPAHSRARTSMLPDLSEALSETGELDRADEILSEAILGADSMGDRGLHGHATIVRLLLMESRDPKHRSEVALRELENVIPVFEELGDDLGLARAWRLTADVHWTRARYASVDRALEQAIEHARKAGAGWEEAEGLGVYTGSGVFGPTPVAEVVERCERVLGDARGNKVVEARAFRSLGALRAMEGRFDEARDLVRRAAEILQDLGLLLRAAFVSETSGFVERLAGDPEAAERELRAGLDVMEKFGEQGYLSTASALLAHSMLDQGRLDDAERFIASSQEVAAEDDLTTQVLLHSARGRMLAGRGDLEGAERSGREAVAVSSETDDVNMRADAMVDLGDVLRLMERPDDASHVLEGSLSLYRGKGNVVAADGVTRRLGELGHPPSGS